MRGDPVITIGERCTLGKGIGIVGHERIEIGNDIWTGHYVYVTDQNRQYWPATLPLPTEAAVSVPKGDAGHGVVVAAADQHR